MRVRFWGTRGSIPAAGPETLRYGGNTACVEVRTDDGTLLIFDCGTGARKLGIALAEAGPVKGHLFVGHTHTDHISGWPFFGPAFMADTHLTVYGPAGIDRSLPKAIGGLMDYAYFPVPMGNLPARLEFQELGEGELTVGNVQVRTQYLNHTAPCLGYRVEVGGASFVYATDHEPHTNQLWRPDRSDEAFVPDRMLHAADARHAEFLRDADLVIHDAQYTAAEYPNKTGWGHSTIEYAIEVAMAARVKHIVLFHHDPTRTDDQLDALLLAMQERVAAVGGDLIVTAAAEGSEVVLDERPEAIAPEPGLRSTRVPARSRILIAEDDDGVGGALEAVLEDDGYEVVRAADGSEALQLVSAQPFDLILLDLYLPGKDGLEVCRALRSNQETRDVPIIVLTARAGAGEILAGFDQGVTDYMTKPFALPQLRARVHTWLNRRAGEQP